MPTGTQPSIRIAGDSTIDWRVADPPNAAHGEIQTAYQWDALTAPGFSAEAGGAALLGRLVQEATESGGATVAVPLIPAPSLIDPADSALPRTFGIWRPYQAAWRLERFLGVSQATKTGRNTSAAQDGVWANCVALDDSGLGFRDRKEQWPAELTRQESTPANVFYKIAGQLTSNPLQALLVDAHSEALTTYVAVGDLRKADAAIGQPHSWQLLAEQVVAAVRNLDAVRHGRRTIVSLGMAGAVIVERDGDATLIFDPMHQEGDWERTRFGFTPGLGTCVLAALTLAVVEDPSHPDWVDAVAHGLIAARNVHERGFERDEHGAITFPVATAIADLQRLGSAQSSFSVATIAPDREWLVPINDKRKLWHLAKTIVLDGDSSVDLGLPVERMGAWVSVDRTEIEGVRSVRLIVDQYLSQKRQPRPLNLAVFGPPGSGKSFAVKQMANEWKAGGERIEILEFNVAQFSSTDDLVTSLQRVRDAAVTQTLPLVFWDEFDATFENREFGWLSRFLAPMQDGAFLEDGVVRPIGPAIFVFAGGLHATLASFKERAEVLKGAKGTDFLSRLRGHIDILGPNPPVENTTDMTFMLRRALLLRAQLVAKAKHLATDGRINIDPGVLRAFLMVDQFLHGARSMEALIEMSGLSSRLRFERSALPTPYQMALHVDTSTFLHWIEHEAEFEHADASTR